MENSITRQIEIKAPVSKVWKALTDSESFGKWFKANIHGPFEAGKTTLGQNTHPGYEFKLQFMVQAIRPETYFSYRWIPYPADPTIDYREEEPTLVEFFLEETVTGTRLKVVESGFNKITARRRAEAYKMHSGGWEQQLKNIEAFLA